MVLVGQWTARQCCMAIGYVFPVYRSSRALRRQDTHELLQWVTFWTVNALFYAVELVGDTVIGWVPFYLEAKIAFLLWLVLPTSAGARVLHDAWLAPTFEKHEEVIDLTLTDMKRRASEKVKEVCKETAVLALRRGSGVVAQGQQYVAAQLVQQALGKLQTPTSTAPSSSSSTASAPASASAVSVSSVLSLLAAAATPMTPVVSSVSTAPVSLAAEAKSSKKEDEALMPKASGVKARADDDEDEDADCKSELKTSETKALHKDVVSSDTHQQQHEKPAPITSPKPSSSREEKSKELVAHFKKLLVKGFAVTYHAAEGSRKQRCIRLETSQSRHVLFESAKQSSPDNKTSKKQKVLRLCIHNIRRIASGRGDADVDADTNADIDIDRAFVLDNGKSVLLFEAESAKTRDLLVAGMRLLIAERKRIDTAALTTLVAVRERQLTQHAFDRWLYATQQR